MDPNVLATANPQRLLDGIRGQASERKLRLLVCACVRALPNQSVVQRCLSTIEVAERFADGRATADDLRDAREVGFDSNTPEPWKGWIALSDAYEATRYVLPECLRYEESVFWVWERRRRLECRGRYNQFVADLFGPLLSRPVAFAPDWRTSSAVQLARQMYDAQDFAHIPILADALQDAGCEDAAVLDHCRGPGPHVRGCWVVDLVLGKT